MNASVADACASASDTATWYGSPGITSSSERGMRRCRAVPFSTEPSPLLGPRLRRSCGVPARSLTAWERGRREAEGVDVAYAPEGPLAQVHVEEPAAQEVIVERRAEQPLAVPRVQPSAASPRMRT